MFLLFPVQSFCGDVVSGSHKTVFVQIHLLNQCKQTMIRVIQIILARRRIPTAGRQTSWLFTSAAEVELGAIANNIIWQISISQY